MHTFITRLLSPLCQNILILTVGFKFSYFVSSFDEHTGETRKTQKIFYKYFTECWIRYRCGRQNEELSKWYFCKKIIHFIRGGSTENVKLWCKFLSGTRAKWKFTSAFEIFRESSHDWWKSMPYKKGGVEKNWK